MSNVATTKLSSRGQVVIPDEVRKKLRLKTGAKFIVLGEKDIVILKNITAPDFDEFDDLIKQARKTAKTVGLKKSDKKMQF